MEQTRALHEWNLNIAFRLKGTNFGLKNFPNAGGSSSFSLPPVKLRAISRSFLCIRTMPRRFRPSWSVEEQEACFVVRDHDGQELACVYFEDGPGRRSAANLLTKDETWQIASNLFDYRPIYGLQTPPCIV